MARHNPTLVAHNATHDLTPPRGSQRASSHALSTHEGSDKENQPSKTQERSRKRRSDTHSVSVQDDPSTDGNKRLKTQVMAGSHRSRVALQEELNTRVDSKYYDPDQNITQIRTAKKQYRDLLSRVNDSRSEFLQANSKGIENALDEADRLYSNVKQTSVATIDSRLLVNVGDLAHKKVNTLTLGDSSTGVDVDDFVTQCIRFMKRSDEDDSTMEASSTTQPSQRQRNRRRRQIDPEAEDDDDDAEGDPMNWSHLGRTACILYNSRPCLSGFLLGPLSVRKKARQQTQRRARQTQADPSQAARPTELGDEDLEQQESANLTVICGDIARLLNKKLHRGQARVQQQYESEYTAFGTEPTQAEIQAMAAKHGIADNGCVPLFNFCVNPKSFGQTVENMFYVSFLIKEGKVGLDFDTQGLPTLGTAEAKTVAERQETQRNQAVFTLDFDIWRELVESFGIQQSIIPHREEEDWDDGTVRD